MCGIFGYSGNRDSVKDILLDGLKRLEYRGYDSWGIAVLDRGVVNQYKNVGEIKGDSGFKRLSNGSMGIGHTRWATHGGVTEVNAHPHLSESGEFTVAQNGIVENYEDLKRGLIKGGVKFQSETDTEVILRLLEREVSKGVGLRDAVVSCFKMLQGRNTIAVLDGRNSCIYAVRNGSPLVVGLAKGEVFVASDTLSFSPYTKRVMLVENGEMVVVRGSSVELFDIYTGRMVKREIKVLKEQYEEIGKGDFPHYMIKEIVEQSRSILYASNYSKRELETLVNAIKGCRRVYTLGAGTAGFAGGQVGYFLRNIVKKDCVDVKSYEYGSVLNTASKRDLVLSFSQSGETADTIEAIEAFKGVGCRVASVVNMLGTTISRLSDFEYYCNAGPEICVASTKVFTAQCVWGYLLAMAVIGRYVKGRRDIRGLARGLESIFNQDIKGKISGIDSGHMFILGKGSNYNIALEGALKIKEISYSHVEGFSAGELKHGVIALVEKGTPVFGILSDDFDGKDVLSGMEQVKARGAFTVGVGPKVYEGCSVFDEYIVTPDVGDLGCIANVVPFQLISYYLALELGNSIDKPRNLAKSVTVK